MEGARRSRVLKGASIKVYKKGKKYSSKSLANRGGESLQLIGIFTERRGIDKVPFSGKKAEEEEGSGGYSRSKNELRIVESFHSPSKWGSRGGL